MSANIFPIITTAMEPIEHVYMLTKMLITEEAFIKIMSTPPCKVNLNVLELISLVIKIYLTIQKLGENQHILTFTYIPRLIGGSVKHIL